ncbi:16S rRNA (cytosine(967)-C(5))-methyltransferase RsmB [Ottowia testudinis]|uniref:16S rRNA (Cytosine(967)-C(5))-methyltransferase RsmB n=1 Tax=Ottowia testudinis TaxID=2816950 RepID=A0A975H7W5_9BURK|nr:16S rRNA (cytosine(967)-C(5))-methyltransferase RsmB [Ottowia testudinis]QTD47477.1 16S rRNA (cytosine(967)-C(5))-methyltransferase RsmB [Ottowia testudinis]
MSPSTSHGATPTLWRQLQATARLVQGVREGRSLTAPLDRVDPVLRPGVQALSFHALRWLGLAQALRQQLVQRAPPPAVDALLCTSLALAQPADDAPYDPFTLVDQAVEAAKRDRVMRPRAPFINACLRSFLRERAALMQAVGQDPVARWNHPRWWVERLQRDHPTQWEAILAAAQQAAPMDWRVNLQRTTVQQFCGGLATRGIESHALDGAAVRLRRPQPVSDIPGFAQGHASVQSASAQRAAPLLLGDAVTGAPLVLDACAAPGGKTAHLLELCPGARVVALEIDPERSRRIGQNLMRLGLHADLRVADAGDVPSWWRGERYDAILLDAPCSASGIVSRHPDVRWLRKASDIAQLAAQQDRLLAALWPLLRPGGRLLYCTCSVFVEEGEARIQSFLANNSDVARLTAPGHLLPLHASPSGLVGDNDARDDGFYYALLRKRPPDEPPASVGGMGVQPAVRGTGAG